MNLLAQKFLENPSESNAFNLIHGFREHGMYNTNLLVGDALREIYPHNLGINSELAISAFGAGKYEIGYDLYTENLSYDLKQQQVKDNLHNQHFSVPKIKERYAYYNKDIVDYLVKRKKKPFPIITLSITTCKRFDLFEKTINSFLNCCTDLDKIDNWFCIDDNSSEEDRKKMKDRYPFFTFYFKKYSEKGHPQSMNIIRNYAISNGSKFLFHMEDDWLFFKKHNYLTDCMDVLSSNNMIRQCLINQNYGETYDDYNIRGGRPEKTLQGTRYYVHEQAVTQEERQEFARKYGGGKNCAYWPQYSLRPSLLELDMWVELGPFNEKVSHFEMVYAQEYNRRGYKSAFLEGISTLHTGRLTSQRNNKEIPNAYDLNNEVQFSGKEKQLERGIEKEKDQGKEIVSNNSNNEAQLTQPVQERKLVLDIELIVINLDRRPDRLASFTEEAKKHIPQIRIARFEAVDGKKLESTHQLQRLFDGNDYNMRRGCVATALSHLFLWTRLWNSNKEMYCIFEDDIKFVPDFQLKFLMLFVKYEQLDWDIIYLGNSLRKEYRDDNKYDEKKQVELEKMDVKTSLKQSLGGAFGYLIKRKCIPKLLDFIDERGMTNCIDTMQQKAADRLNIYYCKPHLVSTPVADNISCDSDIQFDFKSLTVPLQKRLEEEKEFYGEGNWEEIKNVEEIKKKIGDYEEGRAIFYKGSRKDVNKLYEELKEEGIKSYKVESTCLIVVPKPTEWILENRSFHRLKKGDTYSVKDAIKFKE